MEYTHEIKDVYTPGRYGQDVLEGEKHVFKTEDGDKITMLTEDQHASLWLAELKKMKENIN